MKLKISGSVGKGGANNSEDVKVICALLNVWLRFTKKTALPIKNKSDATLISVIEDFQKNKMKSKIINGRIDKNDGCWDTLLQTLKLTRTKVGITLPKKGTLTFQAEGLEGGIYHSRILHVPGPTSGLTIGRGYDMKMRSKVSIQAELIAAKVDTNLAAKISNGAKKSGSNAEQSIIDNDLLDFEISASSQLALFNTVYAEIEKDVKRICSKSDVIKTYGETDWTVLDPKIKDLLVDLRYRGDYTSAARKIIQKHVVNNDLNEIKKAMENENNWPNVPSDRFNRRNTFLK